MFRRGSEAREEKNHEEHLRDQPCISVDLPLWGSVQLAEQSEPCRRHGSDHIERQHGNNDAVVHVPAEDRHQLHRSQVDDGAVVLGVHPVHRRQWVRRMGNNDNGQHPTGGLCGNTLDRGINDIFVSKKV